MHDGSISYFKSTKKDFQKGRVKMMGYQVGLLSFQGEEKEKEKQFVIQVLTFFLRKTTTDEKDTHPRYKNASKDNWSGGGL